MDWEREVGTIEEHWLQGTRVLGASGGELLRL